MQRRNLPLNPVEEDDDEPAFLYQDEMLEFGLGILPQHYHPEYDKKLVTFFTKNSLMTPPPFLYFNFKTVSFSPGQNQISRNNNYL